MLAVNEVKEVLKKLETEYSQTTTALKFDSEFQLLISTMLAAQSTDKRVNIVTADLYREYPDAGSFLTLEQTELQELIKSIGLYKSKAKNILATCKILVEKYKGEVPQSREELMQLPGVGRKTANVVLSIAHEFDAIAVDTHVFRVSNRIGLANAADVRKTEDDLMRVIPKDKWSAAHHWLIWHGRNICRARNPLCEECMISAHCLYLKLK